MSKKHPSKVCKRVLALENNTHITRCLIILIVMPTHGPQREPGHERVNQRSALI